MMFKKKKLQKIPESRRTKRNFTESLADQGFINNRFSVLSGEGSERRKSTVWVLKSCHLYLSVQMHARGRYSSEKTPTDYHVTQFVYQSGIILMGDYR